MVEHLFEAQGVVRSNRTRPTTFYIKKRYFILISYIYNKIIIMEPEEIKKAVLISESFNQTLRNLNLNTSGGNYKSLKKIIEKNNIDISHFLTRKQIIEKCNLRVKLSNDEIFTKNKLIAPSTVKRRIIAEKLIDYKCNECGIKNVYNNKEIILHLDHKDGDNSNNELNNLRFLCPNCHSQTSTYSGRNKIKSIQNRNLKKQKLNNKDLKLLEIKNKILESNIDFSKKTWGVEVAKLLNKSPQYCLKFVKSNFKELLIT
jgi:5-methylcytosine-specific restriction endonuclease McrA